MTVRSTNENTSARETNNKLNLLHRGILLIAAMIAMFGWMVMTSRILSDAHPFWDIASHMSWHTWIALTVTLLASLVGLRIFLGDRRVRWWHRLIMALPPWFYMTWVTTPWCVLPLAPNDSSAPGLKILSWNLWMFNKDTEAVLKLVEDSKADVVILIEVGTAQAPALKSLESIYPYCHWLPDQTSRGIAMLSRIEGTQFKRLILRHKGCLPSKQIFHEQTDMRAIN